MAKYNKNLIENIINNSNRDYLERILKSYCCSEYWTIIKDERIKIEEMAPTHLRNTLKMLVRKGCINGDALLKRDKSFQRHLDIAENMARLNDLYEERCDYFL